MPDGLAGGDLTLVTGQRGGLSLQSLGVVKPGRDTCGSLMLRVRVVLLVFSIVVVLSHLGQAAAGLPMAAPEGRDGLSVRSTESRSARSVIDRDCDPDLEILVTPDLASPTGTGSSPN